MPRKRRKNQYDGDPRHARIMAAARHLNASRMGWVACRFTSGLDYTGSTKGLIADTLIGRALKPYQDEYAEERLAKIEAYMRAQAGSDGFHTTALRRVDAPIIRADVDRLIESRDENFRLSEEGKQNTGKTNYKYLNAAQHEAQLVRVYERALARIEE
jgi:hypothetical protein